MDGIFVNILSLGLLASATAEALDVDNVHLSVPRARSGAGTGLRHKRRSRRIPAECRGSRRHPSVQVNLPE